MNYCFKLKDDFLFEFFEENMLKISLIVGNKLIVG